MGASTEVSGPNLVQALLPIRQTNCSHLDHVHYHSFEATERKHFIAMEFAAAYHSLGG